MEEELTPEKMMAGMRYMPMAIGRVEAAFQMAEFGRPQKDEYDEYLVELGLKTAIEFKSNRHRWVQEAKVVALNHLLTMWCLENDAVSSTSIAAHLSSSHRPRQRHPRVLMRRSLK